MPSGNSEETTRRDATEDIRARMRRGLVAAMKARDQQTVAALRSTLAAIDNAEAVDPDELDADEVDEPVTYGGEGHPAVAGSVLGVGAAELDRRILTPEETAEIVRDEVTAREVAADVLERIGRPDQAERLRSQAKLLTTYLDPPPPPPSAPPPPGPPPPGPPPAGPPGD
jgi:uncharacterized protein YqeY